MKRETLILGILLIALISVAVEAKRGGGSSSRRKSGSGGGGYRRTTPRPRTTQATSHASAGSEPGKVGWNVPHKDTKPSAPEQTVSKASATSVQSGYSPSGGYPKQPPYNPSAPVGHGPPPYSPSAPVGHGPPPYSQSAPVGHGPPPYSQSAPVGHGPPAYSPSYNPSGGYNPSAGHGYNPVPGGQSYHPAPGGHSPYGQPYGPVGGGQSYNPSSFSHPQIPTIGGSGSSFGSQPQTIFVQQQSSRPGIGQLAKEAFVFAGVSAGVNAAVNRLIPGGIYGTRGTGGGGGGGGAPGTTHTEITYNNYYNNGTSQPSSENNGNNNANGNQPAAAASANQQPPPAPAGPPPAAAAPTDVKPLQETNSQTNQSPPKAQDGSSSENNPNPLGFVITDADLKKLTEDLYSKDKNNAFKHMTMNLQGQKTDESVTDAAPEPLLAVKAEAYDIPTVKAVLPLLDNYELNVRTKEEVTSEERREESDLLDAFLATETLSTAMKFLASKGYIPNDEYEFKDTLKRTWFSQFKRIDGEPSSSGFETVFLAEQFDNDIIGLHNWIYFAKQEENKKLNYLGYMKKADLGSNGAIVKLRSSLNDIVQPVTTIFVGTSPELEMALYTLCFYTRPNNPCPVSLGGTEFTIYSSRVNYFGKDILISAYPDI